MDIDRPTTPEPVRSQGFTYSKDGIKANSFPRASLSELRLLFRKNAAKSRMRAATKPWVTAQLKLYGIPFKASDSARTLKDALETAVKSGKCNTVAPSIAALEKALSDEYGQLLKAHAEELDRWRAASFATLNSPTEQANFDLDRFLSKYFLNGLREQPASHKTKDPITLTYVCDQHNFAKAVESIPGLGVHFTWRLIIVGWKDQLERGIDAEFAKLDSPIAKLHIPTSEANFDLDRFLAKYFLDSLNGKPLPHKTLDPITLYPFFEHRNRLGAAVALIPGLHVLDGKGEYGLETVIGWDIDNVRSQVRQIEEGAEREKARKAAGAAMEREREWQETLQSHREYAKTHRVPDGPLKLDDLTGSYIVRCDEIMKQYTLDRPMSLDIGKPRNQLGTEAAFHFGVIEGTMMLALSEDSLERLSQVDVDSDEDTNQDLDGPWTGVQDHSGPTKRVAKVAQAAQASKKLKRETTFNANRIYLQWAGRATGDGEIQLDTDNENTGYLDVDKPKLSAKGVFSSSWFGKDIPFLIFKVSNLPSTVPKPWSSFSSKQYNYESRARWGNGCEEEDSEEDSEEEGSEEESEEKESGESDHEDESADSGVVDKGSDTEVIDDEYQRTLVEFEKALGQDQPPHLSPGRYILYILFSNVPSLSGRWQQIMIYKADK